MKKITSKITKNHSTFIEAAAPFLKLAKKDEKVTKISLGIISFKKTGAQKRIKCTITQACVLMQIRGNRAIQEIRFFTNQLQKLKSDFETFAQSNSYEVSK